jgi:NAD+ kinase
VKRIGILYHPKIEKARAFSRELEDFLSARRISFWSCSAWEEEKSKPQVAGSDLILSIGGDGTILRAARAIVPEQVPIVGINFGSLGFMTELKADEALKKLPRLLDGEGWLEERVMLQTWKNKKGKVFHVLNDVVVGRGGSARLVNVEAKIDGEVLATYRADGVIVATATGSTSYSLAAGGPVLHPQSKDILLNPVCSHLTLNEAVVLPAETVVKLRVATNHEAMLSLDGQVESKLASGDEVTVELSPYMTRFLRLQPRNYFYSTLESRLRRKI